MVAVWDWTDPASLWGSWWDRRRRWRGRRHWWSMGTPWARWCQRPGLALLLLGLTDPYPVTDELALEVSLLLRCLFLSFSLSFSLRRLLLFFFSLVLGVPVADSLDLPLSAGTPSSGWVSSSSTASNSSPAPGVSVAGAAKPDPWGSWGLLTSCSFRLGRGPLAWEFSTSLKLPSDLAGNNWGGALGGGSTRLAVVGRLAEDWVGCDSGCGLLVRAAFTGGLSTCFLFRGLSSKGSFFFHFDLHRGSAAHAPQCPAAHQPNLQAGQNSRQGIPMHSRRDLQGRQHATTLAIGMPFDRVHTSECRFPGKQNGGTCRTLGGNLSPLPSRNPL